MQIPHGPIGKLNSENKDITIIGAGISGLLIGYYLKKAGYNITIYEKENKVGGKIGTIDTDYGLAETAANAIYSNDDVLELVKDLQLEFYKASPKLKKYVWRKGKPKAPPFTLIELLKIFFGLFKKIDRTNLHQKTVFDFFSPMMGHLFTKEIMSAALGGIYAEPSHRIHFQSLFKTPFQAKTYLGFFKELFRMRKNRSKEKATSISFPGGMQTFIEALRLNLKEHIFCSHELNNILPNTIICTDAQSASKITENRFPRLAKLLSQIEYNSLHTTTVFTKRPIPFLKKAFGVVFPPGENFKTLGILHNTEIFPDRVIDTHSFSYTFMTKTKDNIEAVINQEINRIAGKGFDNNIIYRQTTPWERAIPIYDLNRYNTILALRSEMNNTNGGLVIFGNYVDGVAIRELVSAAKALSQSLKNRERKK